MKFSFIKEDHDGNPKPTWLTKGILVAILLPVMIAVVALNSTTFTLF